MLNWQTPYQAMLTDLSKIRIKFAVYRTLKPTNCSVLSKIPAAQSWYTLFKNSSLKLGLYRAPF